MARKEIKFFHDTKRQAIHFMSGPLGMAIGFDLWVALDSGRDLFGNVEYILQGVGEAHNCTCIEKIGESGRCIDYCVTYNGKED